jgi:hypothetical protein
MSGDSAAAYNYNVIRHKLHAELAFYASATSCSLTFKTFRNAQRTIQSLKDGSLTLTAEILSRNQPHSPATALGHITASRSGIRSTRPQVRKKRKRSSAPGPPATSFTFTTHDALATTRSQTSRSPTPRAIRSPPLRQTTTAIHPTIPRPVHQSLTDGSESLDQYATHELRTTILQTCILPPSELRDTAMFCDVTRRFPATAMDLLLSVYKRYIHLELLASRTKAPIIDAYSRTYQ